MNELIKKQLQKCKVARIPEFDDNTTQITISRDSVLVVNEYMIHKYFICELADYMINPPPNFTLADNWNRGTKPKYKHYKCEISAVMGDMCRITGCGYNLATDTDYNEMWEGWVPIEGIKLLKELR